MRLTVTPGPSASVSFIFLLFACAASFAQPQISEVVVTGSRIAGIERPGTQILEVGNAGSMETVIGRSLTVDFDANGGPGSLNDLRLRGADSNQTLVLFNGVPVNDSTNSRGGVADLGGFDPWYIDNIGIATGATSSIYGSQANVGVVQLVSPLPEPGFRIGTGADTQGGYFLGATQGFENVSLSLARRRQPESVTGSRYEADSALVQVDSDIGEDDRLRLVLWGLQAEAEAFPDDSGGYRFAANRRLETRDIEDFSVSLNYVRNVPVGALNLQFSHRRKSEIIDTPAVFPGLRDPRGLPAIASDNRLDLTYASAYVSGGSGAIGYSIGLDHLREDADSESLVDLGFAVLPAGFDVCRDTTGLFVEVVAELSNELDLIVSGRHDNSSFADEFSPSLTLDWQFSEASALFTSWAEGFKLPSFYGLYNPLVGNPALDTETSQTLEVGYRYETERLSLALTGFDYRFTNLIDFDPGPPPGLVNRNRVDSKGFEVSIQGQVIDERSTASLGYVRLDAESADGSDLLGRPKNRVAVRFTRSFTSTLFAGELLWSSSFTYNDAQLGSSIPTGQIVLGSYRNLSTMLEFSPSETGSWAIGLANLLDEKYSESPGNFHEGIRLWATFELEI